MSLSDFVYRYATIQALKDQTFAGQNVFDEPVDPMENVFQLSEDASSISTMSQVIAVYTNISEDKSKDGSNDIYGGESWCEISLQIYIPFSTTVATDAVTGAVKGRAGGAKLVTDLIERQIEVVMLSSTSPWANLRRKMQTGIESIRRQSFMIKTDGGADVVSREITVRANLIAPPPIGLPLTTPYQTFLDLLDAGSDEQKQLATVFRSAIGPTSLNDSLVAMAALGASPETIQMIGLGPVVPLSPTSTPPTLNIIDIINDEGGGITIDEPLP